MMPCIKTAKACLLGLFAGLLGALISLTPLGISLEEIGLDGFYKLRGPIASPKDVVIISIDKTSAKILHLPDDPEKWPRSYYARLLHKIHQQNPALVAFNINFAEPRDSKNDSLLAEMMKLENVILSSYLERRSISLDLKSRFDVNNLSFERVVYPTPLIEDAALEVCPFLLPKTSSSVKQFWAYKASAGDAPTFPTCIFHASILKRDFKYLLKLSIAAIPSLKTQIASDYQQLKTDRLVTETALKIFSQFRINPANLERFKQLLTTADFSEVVKTRLQSWVNLFDAGNSLYFNHYGKAGAISTIPFYQALVSDILNPDTFHNKIVLIGYSENIQPEKNPGFYTVFSNSAADTVSPIEIAATAVANMLDNSWIKPLPPYQQFLMTLFWGIFLAVICRCFSYKSVLAIILMACVLNFTMCYQLFRSFNLWLPISIPIIIQTPLVLLAASVFHFHQSNQSHQNMQKAFSFYLPKDVVDKISVQPGDDAMNTYGELRQGVCLATDAGQYTTLSESMDPMTLADLMNKYYAVMFPLVKVNGGIVSDVIGDAMMALWAFSNDQENPKEAACLTAIEIMAAVDRFNQDQEYNLPTRIGLHYGAMRLGNVGAKEHYEYRAVGDIINTATRIEGLNKRLGTRKLASAEVIQDLPGLITREIGDFILKGKTRPINIHEIVGKNSNISASWLSFISEFSKALDLFKQYQWQEALDTFLTLSKTFPDDGPTRFYVNYLTSHLPFETEEVEKTTATAVIETDKINT